MRNLIQLAVATTLALTLSGCGSDNDRTDKKQPMPSNNAPSVADASFTTQADTELNGQLQASDADGDTLTFTLDMAPTNGTVTVNADGSFSYQPMLEYTGSDSFSFTVDDGKNMAVAATAQITVDALQVSFSSYSRAAFTAASDAMPARVNGRIFSNDVDTTEFYQDLVDASN